MKTRILLLVLSLIIVAAWEFRNSFIRAQHGDAGISGSQEYRLDGPNLELLTKAAQMGNCVAAHKLGRHHSFSTLNHDDAIRWLRIAAKCPDVSAKGELIALLMYLPEDDREVDRLVLEIEQLDQETGASTRESVAFARAYRDRTN